MRVLATIGFSFSAGVFLAALLPWTGWQLYAAGGVLLLALAWLFAARKQKYFRRGLLILLPLAVSLAYFAGYDHLVRQPIEDRCGAASDFAATVCDWPQATERGAKIPVELEGYHRARAMCYMAKRSCWRPDRATRSRARPSGSLPPISTVMM